MEGYSLLTEVFKNEIDFDEHRIITDDLCDTLYISSKLSTDVDYSTTQPEIANAIKQAFKGKCKVIELNNTKDIWARDYMPVQIRVNHFWKFVYNPNYLQSKINRLTITDYADVELEIQNPFYLTSKKSEIIADGGNVIKCDDYIIMTDKVFVEAKNITKRVSWINLRKELGVDVVILPRDPEDRFGHADGMVRYAGPGRVLFRSSQDEEDKEFLDGVIQQFKRQKPEVEILQFDFSSVKYPNKHNWSYINFLRVGNHILVPQLSEEGFDGRKKKLVEEDKIAMDQLHKFFPQCSIQGIRMGHFIERGGGALNCLTWTIKSNF